LRRDFHQGGIFEFSHRRRRGFGQREQFRQRNFAPLLDNVPHVLLSLGQFWKFTTDGERADEQPFAPARVFLAHRFGQNTFQRDLRCAAIILANPARELQNFRRHQSLRADDFENGLEIKMAGFFRERGDHAENFPRAERHLHPAAHINLSRQFRRNGIIKFLPQRDFQTDAGDHF